MRSHADLPALAVLVAVLSACAGPPAPSPTIVTTPGSTQSPPATAGPTPHLTPQPVGLDLPQPGRPFDGPALLREMEASTRPGGVPPEARTLEVADAIADRLWTFDGSAWDTFAVGGFCATPRCTIEVAGTRLGHVGEDLWIVELDVATGSVDVAAAELRSLPPDLVDDMDALVREADGAPDLDGMQLTTARWLPPPDEDRFILSYRSGSLEGSCRRDVTLAAAEGRIVEVREENC